MQGFYVGKSDLSCKKLVQGTKRPVKFRTVVPSPTSTASSYTMHMRSVQWLSLQAGCTCHHFHVALKTIILVPVSQIHFMSCCLE